MAQANIGQVGNLAASEPLDLDTYEDRKSSGGGFSFPKRGRYTFRAPDTFPDTAFGETKSGAFSAQVDPSLVDSPETIVRFTRVSSTLYDRNGKKVSMLGDYLRACGIRGRIDPDEESLKAAVRSTANMTYEGLLDWELFARGHGEDGTDLSIKGMKNFPINENTGEPTPYVASKTEKNEDGTPKILRANLRITSFYPAN